eukprot:10063362-Karenia_brevis.AAC.1
MDRHLDKSFWGTNKYQFRTTDVDALAMCGLPDTRRKQLHAEARNMEEKRVLKSRLILGKLFSG